MSEPRRAFVTGATGFIGSHLTEALLAEGLEVHAFVRPGSAPRVGAPRWAAVRRHEGDLRDAAALARALRESRAETVYHLAKPAGSGFEEEAAGSLRVAAAAEAAGARRLVRTAHAVRPEWGRDADAALAERLRRGRSFELVTLELFAVYGPGQPAEHFPASLARSLSLERGGRDGDGPGWKDLVFVADVVEAYRLAGTRAGLDGARFEIGSGRLTHHSEVEAALRRLLGRASPRSDVAAAAAAHGHAARPREAAERLGWRPSTSLEQGLSRLLEWLAR